MNHNL